MILVIWQNIPESIKLYALPDTEKNRTVVSAAHGHYIGTSNEAPAVALCDLLASEVPFFDEEVAVLPGGLTPMQRYTLIAVSGIFL